MPSKGYTLNADDHEVKHRLNSVILSEYAGYHASNAVILPSITCNDVIKCKELGIFDANTRFLAFERGVNDHDGNLIKPYDFFRILESKFNSIFECDRILNRYCKTVMGDIRKNHFGMDPKNIGKFDFGNYDTCSYPYDAGNWFRSQIDAFKSGSPVLFTFDADYNNRKCRPMSGRKVGNDVIWYGMENIENYSRELIQDVEIKCRRVAWALRQCGLDIKSLYCYKEHVANSKVMMVISSVKR